MNPLKIRFEDVEDVKVVLLSGPIALGDCKLLDLVRDLLSKGNKKLLLDMTDVPYVDSTGIGELVAAYSSARRRGAQIQICGIAPRVRSVLEVIHLMRDFKPLDSMEDGLKAFN